MMANFVNLTHKTSVHNNVKHQNQNFQSGSPEYKISKFSDFDPPPLLSYHFMIFKDDFIEMVFVLYVFMKFTFSKFDPPHDFPDAWIIVT